MPGQYDRRGSQDGAGTRYDRSANHYSQGEYEQNCRRGNVAANVTDYQTSDPKIFACGDMRRGQSLVVWAIREGRQAARAVDEMLMGTSELPR